MLIKLVRVIVYKSEYSKSIKVVFMDDENSESSIEISGNLSEKFKNLLNYSSGDILDLNLNFSK